MNISPFTLPDLEKISALQPPEWNDIVPNMRFYVNSPICEPIKLEIDGIIAGVGTSILHKDSAWLAHIIVHPEYRNRGLGTVITQALMDSLQGRGFKTIMLVATPLGTYVYKKLGFEIESEYIFFKGESIEKEIAADARIIHFTDDYREAVLQMDKDIYGEDRSMLLENHLKHVMLYLQDGMLTGCYFPTLQEGLILAETEQAGLDLIALRSKTVNRIVVPMENKTAIDYLLQNGYEEWRRGTRMRLGEPILWQPEKIYGRVSGGLG
jgi:GNAT superfamily N-acetyltransferase